MAGASEAKRTNPPSIHPPHHHRPVGERRDPRSPWPPARPQNYLLPRSPQAKSEEVHSWRRPVRGGWHTSFNPNYTLRAGAGRCPGAGPTGLLDAQRPAAPRQVPVWAASGLPGYPELRRAQTPIGWRRGACAQAGEQPALGAGGGEKPAACLLPPASRLA